MATLVAILGLISHYIFTLSNQVRSEHYWFDLFQPVITHVTSLSPATLDALQQRNLIVITQLQDVELDNLELKRLTHGQLVISSGNGLVWGFKKIADDSVLALSTEVSGRAAYELYTHLIIAALGSTVQPDARNQIINQLDDVFGVQIEQDESADQFLTPSGLERIAATCSQPFVRLQA